MSLDDLKVGTRLAVAFGAILLVVLLFAGTTLFTLAGFSETVERMVRVDAHTIVTATTLRGQTRNLRRFEKDYFLNIGDPAAQAGYLETWSDGVRKAEELIATLQSTASEADRAALLQMRADLAVYERGFLRVVGELRAGTVTTPQEANHSITQQKGEIHRLEETANAVAAHATERLAADEKNVTAELARTKGTTVVALIVALLLVLAASTRLTVSITRPFAQLVQLARRLADGDFTAEVDTSRKDEAGDLLRAMKQMKEQLAEIIAEVRATADALSVGSQQVASTASSLSQGASVQAASMEEASASIEQMSATIEQNAGSARRMQESSNRGAHSAEESRSAVARTREAMRSIARQVSVIDDIAFQINLLALNATIEAKSAGEHGRGFTVVANEVRRLADRSQKSAAEIQQEAARSVMVAEQSDALLRQLAPAARDAAQLSGEVAATSTEQAAGVHQLNASVNQIQSVTQKTASAAEELASTSQMMSSRALALQQLLGFFRVGGAAHVERPANGSGSLLPWETPAQAASGSRTA